MDSVYYHLPGSHAGQHQHLRQSAAQVQVSGGVPTLAQGAPLRFAAGTSLPQRWQDCAFGRCARSRLSWVLGWALRNVVLEYDGQINRGSENSVLIGANVIPCAIGARLSIEIVDRRISSGTIVNSR
jgi:hypothetical protein